MTSIDPEAARKAEEEAEERRLAEIRSHGTMITPQTFAEWKARFEAEMALSKTKLTGEGGEKKDKGLTGKQFFRQLEANNEQVQPLKCLKGRDLCIEPCLIDFNKMLTCGQHFAHHHSQEGFLINSWESCVCAQEVEEDLESDLESDEDEEYFPGGEDKEDEEEGKIVTQQLFVTFLIVSVSIMHNFFPF